MSDATQTSVTNGPLRILLVDDDPRLLRATKLALEAFGRSWIVETFADPHEAFLASFAAPPHVVVTAYRMPHCTGAQLARALRAAQGPSCPKLLLVTGVVGLRRRDRALFDAVCEKPLSPRHLAFQLRSLRASRRSGTISAAGAPESSQSERSVDTGTE